MYSLPQNNVLVTEAEFRANLEALGVDTAGMDRAAMLDAYWRGTGPDAEPYRDEMESIAFHFTDDNDGNR